MNLSLPGIGARERFDETFAKLQRASLPVRSLPAIFLFSGRKDRKWETMYIAISITMLKSYCTCLFNTLSVYLIMWISRTKISKRLRLSRARAYLRKSR